MRLAIKEALKGKANTYPNPRVGAIVVMDGEIISTGYHKRYGAPHAELMAIKKINNDISGATLFVTLEPCLHHGKTNPCTEIIHPKIFSKVVIGSRDPNKDAAGGMEKLLQKGISVEGPICENECRKINKRFFTYYEKKRPYVILKIALTLDGFIAEKNGTSKWITNAKSRKSVHTLRANCDAILVGNRTIEYDNPSLTSHGVGKDPKIILFSQNNIDTKTKKVYEHNPIVLNKGENNLDPKKNVDEILKHLYSKSIQTLLVEGGGITISHFLKADCFDELHVYYAPKLLGKGLSFFHGKNSLEQNMGLTLKKVEKFDNDIKLTYYKK